MQCNDKFLLGPTAVKVLLSPPVVCEIGEMTMMDGLDENFTHAALSVVCHLCRVRWTV